MFFLTRDSINSYDDHPKSCIGICSYWNPPLKEGQYYSFGRQSVSLQKYRFSVLLLSISEKKALMQEAADKEEVQCQKKHFSYLQLSEISLSGKFAFFLFLKHSLYLLISSTEKFSMIWMGSKVAGGKKFWHFQVLRQLFSSMEDLKHYSWIYL